MSSPIYNTVLHKILKNDDGTLKDSVLAKHFRRADVIVSTNVTEYYYAGTSQEYWHIEKHFPNLAPPFDSFFIETKAPTHIRTTNNVTHRWGYLPPEVAAANIHSEMTFPARWGAWFVNVNMPSSDLFDETDDEGKAFSTVMDAQNQWAYYVTLYVQPKEDGPMGPVWTFGFMINKTTGQIQRSPAPAFPGVDDYSFHSEPLGAMERRIQAFEVVHGVSRHEPAALVDMRQDLTENPNTVPVSLLGGYASEALGLLKPLLLSISFMHCRNVERVVEHPSVKLNKKRQSRNLPPINKFHTLRIDPMRKIIDAAARQHRGLRGGSGIEMALHQVRGHFKTYTEERPLLGCHVGTWFWHGATRGTTRRGTVSKDYEVTAE